MAKVRTKKEHKKRVAKRNNVMQQERKKMEKAQKEFFDMIQEENKKGMFNSPTMPLPTLDGPLMINTGGLSINPTILNGPKI
jgi:hypothetical protein